MKAYIGWTLPAIGLAAAAAFVAPTLLGSPPGEALVVAGADLHLLHEASFRSGLCQAIDAPAETRPAAWRVGAIVAPDGSGGFQIVLDAVATAGALESALFLIARDGQVIDLPERHFAAPCDGAKALPPPV